MKTFKDLEFKTHPMGDGVQALIYFDNGYGASVVRSEHTYGGSDGLYELAVLKNGNITYDTHITDDVIGYLKEEGVTDYLGKIQELWNN